MVGFFINIRNISLLSLFVVVFTPDYLGKNIRNVKFHYHDQKKKHLKKNKEKEIFKVTGI